MSITQNDVIEFIEENDVKFIRLAFCSIFGIQKNISIMPGELTRAFEHGIGFDAAGLPGFTNVEECELLLFPDASTLSILPWRPQQGRVVRFYCDIKYPNGDHFEGDGRHLLKQATVTAREHQLSCAFGTECEFYLFERDELGDPTHKPHDRASFCDIAPLDRGENVRRDICLTLEEMGIQPETSHHEYGPGQNEIDFHYASALEAADNLTTFKSVVKTVAATNGLYASFLPKPLHTESGSGLHIHISLFRNGRNLLEIGPEKHSIECESFIAGLLHHAAELTLFLNPLTNSYSRLGQFEAPKYISWSKENRQPLIRIPSLNGELSRMELRSPDGTTNPYLAFALLIHAGLDGIDKKMELPPACNINLFTADPTILAQYAVLPSNLGEAIILAHNSEFIRNIVPARILNSYIAAKAKEWDYYRNADDKKIADNELYFGKY